MIQLYIVYETFRQLESKQRERRHSVQTLIKGKQDKHLLDDINDIRWGQPRAKNISHGGLLKGSVHQIELSWCV